MQMPLDLMLYTIAITSAAAVLGGIITMLFPGMHVYNVLGFIMIFGMVLAESINPIYLVSLIVGMMLGYIMTFSSISTLYFQAPDDSTMFFMMPSQKYMMKGKAHAAAMLGAVGSLVGVFIVVVGLPLGGFIIKMFYDVFKEVMFFLTGIVICFILMSEWPKDFGQGQTKWQRLRDGWSTLSWGYLVFILASILGIINFNKPLIPSANAFQSLAPIFIGLFAIPSMITNVISKTNIPPQYVSKSVHLRAHHIIQSGVSGAAGGVYGGVTPGVTPGPSGYMAGHATAQGGETNFLMSMNVNRIVYYVGAATLLLHPNVHLRRGGVSMFIDLFGYTPKSSADYYLIVSALCFAAFFSFILILGLSRLSGKFLRKIDFRIISLISIVLLIIIVAIFTSWQGLVVLTVASGLGLLPVLFQTRRMSLLAVLLTPMFLNMSGAGGTVAKFLGLI